MMEDSESNMTRALNIIKKLITYAVIAVAVCMMIFTVVSVTMFDRTDRSIFGYRAFIVRTDSMSATDFSAGDLILTRDVDDPSTLREGDIITFQSTDPFSFGEIITHKIRSLTTDADGNPGFITYGTTTNTDDSTVVTYNFVLGKYQATLPGVGKFFQFLRTPAGYITCILVPFLVFIVMQGIDSARLFKRYKREQADAMKAERSKLEAERLEAQRMKQELLMLRAQLERQTATDKTIRNAEVESQSSPVVMPPKFEAAGSVTNTADPEALKKQVFHIRHSSRDAQRTDNQSGSSGKTV